MELAKLDGNIIGVINPIIVNDELDNVKVSEFVINKCDASLKMVGLPIEIKDKSINELSISEKNKVILASKLNNKCIILNNFSEGLTKKEIDNFKLLFKKISSYGIKIILVDYNAELFLNCVDTVYVINNDEVVYQSNDMYDPTLYMDINPPKIIEFTYLCEDLGVHINEYTDFDELIKAIYRIKS